MTKRFLLSLISVGVAAASAADLPIREVILYKSGVGYFERAGPLGAGESARLDFKAGEMNDVLKSLTVEEHGGGKVTGLRYDSSEPLERKLGEFPFQLTPNQPLSVFLDQLKGARVELKSGAETLSGIVISGRLTKGDEKRPEQEQIVVLLDAGELRTLDLPAVTSIRFADPKLQLQLKDYLAALSQSQSKDRRSVYIDSSDSKSRTVNASYMIPVPVWKSSYRLIFGPSGDPVLEGWAIVDNMTGDDWTNVKLAVVSGKPVSFITELYEPRYLQRPTAELAENQAQGPVVYEGQMDAVALAAPTQKRAMAAPLAMRDRAIERAKSVRAFAASSVVANAESVDLGELFEYRFSTPVTVKKSESAMLPFLQQSIGARKLLIYQEDRGTNPMSAAELTNSTGKTLDGGPITVFDAGSYAGEALMETLKSADKRLISYAVDLGTRITTKFDSGVDRIREIHLRRGVLTTRSAIEETKTFTIRNVDAKPKTLLIEHPVRQDYKLLNQKPVETTANAYRFEVKLAPSATEKFAINEERLLFSSLEITNQTAETLAVYVENKNLPEAARNTLQKILTARQQLATTRAQTQRIDLDIASIAHDEERIRQNIQSLNAVSGQQEQVQKYARDLATLESRIYTLRDQSGASHKLEAAQQDDVNRLIEESSF